MRSAEHDNFLQAVVETSRSRLLPIDKGTKLWRAQLGHGWKKVDIGDDDHEVLLDAECPYSPERMKPNADVAADGRINTRGIPCLYLSSDTTTAIKEVRPWVHSYVSVGCFEVAKKLEVVDTCMSDKMEYFGQSLSDAEIERIVWSDIDRAFGTPVTRSDNHIDYIPTQIISEILKINNFDGVRYKSFLGDVNYALFDIDAAELVSCQLYQIDKVQIEYSEQN